MSKTSINPANTRKTAHKRHREPHATQLNTKPLGMEKGANTCPKCHNAEHPKGAKFCIICGLAFPQKGGGASE